MRPISNRVGQRRREPSKTIHVLITGLEINKVEHRALNVASQEFGGVFPNNMPQKNFPVHLMKSGTQKVCSACGKEFATDAQ